MSYRLLGDLVVVLDPAPHPRVVRTGDDLALYATISLAEALVGFDDAKKMFDLSLDGLRWLRGRIDRHGIDCDWRDGHATVPIKPRQQREVLAAVEDFNTRYDYPVEWWDREKLREQLASDRYPGALYDPESGHLHPLDAGGGPQGGLPTGSADFRADRGREDP